MSRLPPSRTDDRGQGAASSSLFTDHPRHFMSHRIRIQFALFRNSTLSSQRSGVASWPSQHSEASQALPMLPCAAPYKDIELQHTMLISALSFLISSLRCLPLTKQNPYHTHLAA